MTTDSSGEEEIGTESRRFPQRRQDEYHIYKEVNSNVLKDIEEARKQQAVEQEQRSLKAQAIRLFGGLTLFASIGLGIGVILPAWLMGEFEHGGSFDWFSTEPEVISLKEFVKKTPSIYDDRSLDRRPVKDIAVIKSTKGPTGSHVDEIKSTISGVEYVFDILGRQADRADSLAPGDKIEFTALVDTRGGNETDRNLRGFGIERVISMVSHTDCTRCAGSGIIVFTQYTRTCYSCGGDGRLGNGTIFASIHCVDCDGYGYKYLGQTTSQPCSDCQGSGLVVPQR
ncbi:hypothetical protein OAV41_03185 [Planctomycetota bacterium]|nr:hypothetical protein [Planctomycetota bacterium]